MNKPSMLSLHGTRHTVIICTVMDTLSSKLVRFCYVMLCNGHVCRPCVDLLELSNHVCILAEAVVTGVGISTFVRVLLLCRALL